MLYSKLVDRVLAAFPKNKWAKWQNREENLFYSKFSLLSLVMVTRNGMSYKEKFKMEREHFLIKI